MWIRVRHGSQEQFHSSSGTDASDVGEIPGASPDSASSADGTLGNDAGSNRGLVFSPYKDTSINMNWNTNVISTNVSGSATAAGRDLVQHGGKAITLAFATGECGSENWAGVTGAAMATTNVTLLVQAGVQ